MIEMTAYETKLRGARNRIMAAMKLAKDDGKIAEHDDLQVVLTSLNKLIADINVTTEAV